MKPRASRSAHPRFEPGSRAPLEKARAAGLLSAFVLVVPRVAAACPTCISSGAGQSSPGWPYFGLILMPFVIAAAIVAVLVWHAGWRRQDLVERLSAWSARLRQRPARAALSPRTHTETT